MSRWASAAIACFVFVIGLIVFCVSLPFLFAWDEGVNFLHRRLDWFGHIWVSGQCWRCGVEERLPA